jgi:hypothetical protein
MRRTVRSAARARGWAMIAGSYAIAISGILTGLVTARFRSNSCEHHATAARIESLKVQQVVVSTLRRIVRASRWAASFREILPEEQPLALAAPPPACLFAERDELRVLF